MKIRAFDHYPMLRDAFKAALKEGRFLRLLPGHDVFLRVVVGDGHRFARVFRKTWKRLPLRVRRFLLSYWAEPGPERALESPRIELNLHSFCSEMRYSSVQCGHRLQFNAKIVGEMPDDVLQVAIALTLVWALQLSAPRGVRVGPNGHECSIFGDEDVLTEHMRQEDDDAIVTEWGFDPESVHRWAVATGRCKCKVIEPDDRPWLFGTRNATGDDNAAEAG
jgi:hypothetical protein